MNYPLHLISSQGVFLLVTLLLDSTFSQLCTVCENVPSEDMADEGLTCEGAGLAFLNLFCKNDDDWTENRYCSQACFDVGLGYEDTAEDMLECCPGCSVCDNVAPSWFKDDHNGASCDFPPMILPPDVFWTTYCARDGWKRNQYCKQTCSDWGVGYEGINCCPKCTRCENEPTPYMIEQGETCETAPKHLLNNHCNKSVYWTEFKFCQKSCFDWGVGYTGVKCCPGCSQCDNRPTPWMEEEDITCENAEEWLFNNNCNKNPYWIANRWCMQACSERKGLGYDGISCCPDCTFCHDIRAPYITNPKRQWFGCTAISVDVPESRPDYAQCNSNTSWIENQWCEQTCFDEGKGYEGINCCPFE